MLLIQNRRKSVIAFFSITLLVALSATKPAAGQQQDPVVESDSLALVEFYHSTNGDNWDNNLSWLQEGQNVSTWTGVDVEWTGTEFRVIEIDLEDNNLSGELPSEIGDLTALEGLFLADNQLTGSIPPEIGNLVNLERLDLEENQLSGEIPVEFYNLTNLERLFLRRQPIEGPLHPNIGNLINLERVTFEDMELSGEIPDEIGNLDNLERLNMDQNNFTGEIPSGMSNLSSIERLNLGRNDFTQAEIPEWIYTLTTLERLELRDVQFEGSIHSDIGNLTDLERLDLRNTGLTGEIPSEIESLFNLERLRLDNNDFTPGEIPDMQNASDLEYLEMANTNRTGEIPDWINTLSDLEQLHLYDNQLEGNLPEMDNLFSLEELYLNNNQLSGEIPSELGNLSNLEGIYLQNNQLSGTIPSELGNLSDLEELLLNNNQLTGDIPSELGNLANLEDLHLHNNQLNGAIPSNLGNLSDLEELLLNNNQLNGEIPIELGGLQELEILNLAHNSLDGNIPETIGNLSELEDLLFSDNPDLTGALPVELVQLGSVQLFEYHNTGLCEPDSDDFRDWLNAIDHMSGTGIVCDPVFDFPISLEWDEIEGADHYEIQISETSEFTSFIGAIEIEDTFYVTSELKDTTSYFWRVRASINDQSTEWSDVSGFETSFSAEAVVDLPVLVSPEDQAQRKPLSVFLIWQKVDHAQDYEVQVAADDSFDELIYPSGQLGKSIANDAEVTSEHQSLDETKVALQVDELEHNSTYYWRVRGVNPNSEGAWSDIYSFSTIIQTEEGPNLVSPSDQADGVSFPVSLLWQTFSDADHYDIQVSESPTFEASHSVNSHESTSYSMPDLKSQTVYYWRVRAGIDGQKTAWSATRTFETKLKRPEIPAWEPDDNEEDVETTPKLVWNESDRAEFYHLQLSQQSDFSQLLYDLEELNDAEFQIAEELNEEETYYWRIRAGNASGYSDWSEVLSFKTGKSTDAGQDKLPVTFELRQNFPNPFNPVTQIGYAVPEQTHVRLDVYNALGQRVATLVNESQNQGRYEVSFDGTGLSSGLYLYRIQTDSFIETRQMLLVK